MSENYCVSLRAGKVLFGCVVSGESDGDAISNALKALQTNPVMALGALKATPEMVKAAGIAAEEEKKPEAPKAPAAQPAPEAVAAGAPSEKEGA